MPFPWFVTWSQEEHSDTRECETTAAQTVTVWSREKQAEQPSTRDTGGQQNTDARTAAPQEAITASQYSPLMIEYEEARRVVHALRARLAAASREARKQERPQRGKASITVRELDTLTLFGRKKLSAYLRWKRNASRTPSEAKGTIPASLREEYQQAVLRLRELQAQVRHARKLLATSRPSSDVPRDPRTNAPPLGSDLPTAREVPAAFSGKRDTARRPTPRHRIRSDASEPPPRDAPVMKPPAPGGATVPTWTIVLVGPHPHSILAQTRATGLSAVVTWLTEHILSCRIIADARVAARVAQAFVHRFLRTPVHHRKNKRVLGGVFARWRILRSGDWRLLADIREDMGLCRVAVRHRKDAYFGSGNR